MKFEDEKILIDSLNKGNEEAFGFLFDKYHDRLYAYALSLVNENMMAQDIVQNVFIRTWKFRKKLNPLYSLQSFLYKTTYNEFVRTYQQNKPTLRVQARYFDTLNLIISESEESDVVQKVLAVSREVEKLPKKCRQIFKLSKVEGLTNMEIAEHLGLSIKTVENQLGKAYKILREKLK